MFREHGIGIGIINSSPGSPPGLTASKSSKSSSFQSLNSDDGSVLADVGHFEEIGLDDDHVSPKAPCQITIRPSTATGRNLAVGVRAKPQRSFPNLRSAAYAPNPRNAGLTASADPRPSNKLSRGYSATAVPRRPRSISPGGLSLNIKDPNLPVRPRRGSWQINPQRKSIIELEQECDDDDDDDIPDGLVLDNVPISPRPPHERPPSRAPSISPTPENGSKPPRTRSIGNGTPSVAQAQGSFRSSDWKNDGDKSLPSPIRSRANSWNAALADLSAETKALTEKLEEHADEMEVLQTKRPSGVARPNTWNPNHNPFVDSTPSEKKERAKSSMPELPPLRRTNIMIDPLPISKEKEAVLSRTRPSWLPPKDPAEERRHLRQYQEMMAASAKAEERRESLRRSKTERRDNAADKLMHIWEDDIIPRWNETFYERRTRELCWKGVAPRSRKVVWARAIGNELGLTEASFRAALARSVEVEQRAKSDRANTEDLRMAAWFEQIRKDVAEKTWKDLRIFEVAGPLHQGLVDVLRAYAMYRNDIGYIRGCNTIAGLLLLNLPNPETTFIALANVLNRPLPLSFYTYDAGARASAFNIVLQTLKKKSSALYEHLTQTLRDVEPEWYLNNVFMGLFTSQLAIDEAARLWDVYVFEGDRLLIQAAVAVLLSREMDLLGSKTAEEVKAVMAKTSAGTTSARAVSEVGAEDRFMQKVREAGKA
ncbi:TBC domain-containing protein [Escovopsis weberi]|uniref:TBC domain-containing protein n=1 Tax=Escovopsis weberi TaxID=150374 RepID=A0A0M9VVQ1_ESCWE|nr:TBC domain-containing protein [Escovopsis weberi]